jgi:hypothetical protein
MAELRQAAGRPMVHELRAVLDAVFCVVRNGIEWRALPVDFPPWEAVYAFFQRWSQREPAPTWSIGYVSGCGCAGPSRRPAQRGDHRLAVSQGR